MVQISEMIHLVVLRYRGDDCCNILQKSEATHDVILDYQSSLCDILQMSGATLVEVFE